MPVSPLYPFGPSFPAEPGGPGGPSLPYNIVARSDNGNKTARDAQRIDETTGDCSGALRILTFYKIALKLNGHLK